MVPVRRQGEEETRVEGLEDIYSDKPAIIKLHKKNEKERVRAEHNFPRVVPHSQRNLVTRKKGIL